MKRIGLAPLLASLIACLWTVDARAEGDWRIINTSSYYPTWARFNGPGECIGTAIAAWHAAWPGHMDAIFTLTYIAPDSYTWIISNNAGGGITCGRPAAVAANPTNANAAGMCTRNPIVPARGLKIRQESDWADGGAAPLALVRYYRSNSGVNDEGIGKGWNTNFGARVVAFDPHAASITLPSGEERLFTMPTGAATWTPASGTDSLWRTADELWNWRRSEDSSVWKFLPSGRLHAVVAANGWTTSYSYDSQGRLASVANPFGRQIGFTYGAAGELSGATLPDGRSIGYQFDGNGRLTGVAYPDGKSRSFQYENVSFPNSLTGITDEGGGRWATFGYDTTGRAVLRRRAARAPT